MPKKAAPTNRALKSEINRMTKRIERAEQATRSLKEVLRMLIDNDTDE